MASQPELAMLWERTDPRVALSERFGFAEVEGAAAWLGEVLADQWGIRLLECERLVISAGNVLAWLSTDLGRLVAKCSVVAEAHPRLAEVAQVLGWLGDRGLPVQAPVPAVDGRHQVEVGGKSIGLQRELLGKPLDADDPRQVTAAGMALAGLHLALAGYPAFPSPGKAPLAERVGGWLGSEAGGRGLAGAEVVRRRLRVLEPAGEPPVQLVHNDFRSANVLWHDGRIEAVIDFDEAGVDCCMADVANAMVLLGTRYHDWGPVSIETQQAFSAGYQAVRPLTELESQWLDLLVLWRTLQAVPAGDDPAGWGKAAEQLAAHWQRAAG